MKAFYIKPYKIINIDYSLGSNWYIKKIEYIKRKLKPRDVLDVIIKDVRRSQIQITLNKDNLYRLCKCINELVKDHMENNPKFSIDKELHYFRNYLNIISPSTLQEMLKKTDWKLMKPEKSIYHMFGKDGEYNLKFVSNDGFFEAVYNKEGQLITDPMNMGTYNYGDPKFPYIDHLLFDIVPYYKYGNALGLPEIDDILYANLNLIKFNNNKDAVNSYKKIKNNFNGEKED